MRSNLEKHSKLVFNKDFYCGYSPEKINPGDKKHRLTDIIGLHQGLTKNINLVDSLYKEIIVAGTQKQIASKLLKQQKSLKILKGILISLSLMSLQLFSTR